jgi:hypothetical protein
MQLLEPVMLLEAAYCPTKSPNLVLAHQDGLAMEAASRMVTLDALAINGMETINNKKTPIAAKTRV